MHELHAMRQIHSARNWSWRLRILGAVLVFVLASACGGSTDSDADGPDSDGSSSPTEAEEGPLADEPPLSRPPSSVQQPDSEQPPAGSAEADEASVSVQVDSRVSAELLGLIYPLDGTVYRAAWTKTHLPIFREATSTMAECIADQGYEVLGELLMTAEPDFYNLAGHRLRDLDALRSQGLPFIEPAPAADVLLVSPIGSIYDPVDDDPAVFDLMIEILREHPELGVAPTVAAAKRLTDAYVGVCLPQTQPSETELQILPMQSAWWSVIDEVDVQISWAFEDYLECMRGTVFGTGGLRSVEEVRAEIDAFTLDRLEILETDRERALAELLEAGREYADCFEPVVEERRKLLAGKRDTLVEENLDSLIALQEWFDDDEPKYSHESG